jgi:hypothetical protein
MFRGEQQQHEGVCPLQPVDCPFHCHGCTAVVKRRDLHVHQVDATVEHAALVSTKVAVMESAAAADRARLAALEARLTTRPVSWKVPAIAAKVAAKDDVYSPKCVFTLPGGETYQVGLSLEFKKAGQMGVYFHLSSVKAGDVSLSRFPVDVGGSTITVKHRAVGGRDQTKTLPADSVISTDGHGKGWDLLSLDRLADYTAADGSMQIEAVVRASVPEVTVLE